MNDAVTAFSNRNILSTIFYLDNPPFYPWHKKKKKDRREKQSILSEHTLVNLIPSQ